MDMRSDIHTHINEQVDFNSEIQLNASVTSCMLQYAFLVTSVVQFAGGVVVFFGLLASPKEVGKE